MVGPKFADARHEESGTSEVGAGSDDSGNNKHGSYNRALKAAPQIEQHGITSASDMASQPSGAIMAGNLGFSQIAKKVGCLMGDKLDKSEALLDCYVHEEGQCEYHPRLCMQWPHALSLYGHMCIWAYPKGSYPFPNSTRLISPNWKCQHHLLFCMAPLPCTL